MTRNDLYHAFHEIDDDILERSEAAAQRKKKPVWLKWSAIAACLTILIVGVEASSGLVSNLLAPLYGGAQTELVNSIGAPIDASTTVNGYTLTADAIIGDQYNIAIIYTLTRESGEPIPKGLSFDSWRSSLHRAGGGSIEFRQSEDGRSMKIIEEWTNSESTMLHGNAKITFEDLIYYDDDGKAEIHVAGVWELNFAVRYKDTTVRLPVDDLEVIGAEGNRYQIHEIELSPLGVHMELTAPNTMNQEHSYSRMMPDFQLSLLLKDGTVVEIVESSYGGGGDHSSDVVDAHYGAMFSEPVPMDAIESLIICDTEYKVN